MMWTATNGQSVREVMNLNTRQRDMTLEQYEAQKVCKRCGQAVPTNETENGRICSPCDTKSGGIA